MSMSSRHRREQGLVPVSVSNLSKSVKIFTADEFQFEVAKEISRSNRRQTAREFSLLRFPQFNQQTTANKTTALVELLQQRIRISDSIGWLNNQLTVLLPETGHQGALTLANSLTLRLVNSKSELGGALAGSSAVELNSEITVYPWDDELISLADELNLPSPENGSFSESERFESEEHEGSLETELNQFENSIGDQSGIVATLERPTTKIVTAETGIDAPPRRRVRRETDRELRKNLGFEKIAAPQTTPISKRMVDVLIAGTGLVVLAPVFVATALAIRCSSRGPVFFRQKREGKDGVVFDILKFRTMVVKAEQMQADLRHQSEQDGPAFKLTKDPRVTKVGRILRKSCVDELPQLWNILKGDMSLVGPRPLPVGESYGCKAWHRARLTVLPGLTCIWQASGRRKEVKFDDWMRMDLAYIRQRTFWFDLRLLVRTAILAITHRGSV